MITFILAVCGNVDYVYSFPQSPPSRAAWIEMQRRQASTSERCCRRLHGRRGLKCPIEYDSSKEGESPPSRAAWIEIRMITTIATNEESRRLHGRRGLKYKVGLAAYDTLCVAAFTGGVD